MQEQHVTTAAKRLFLTQSAISNSLKQLRELFDDELLIRGPKKMLPTQKALALLPHVEGVLQELDVLVFKADNFDHTTSTRTFNLGMIDYMEYVLLPILYQKIAEIAPHISIKVKLYNEFTPDNFENHKLELGLGPEKQVSKQLFSERLFTDKIVCVARKNHPLFKKPLTLKTYLQAEHLAVRVYSEELSRVDQLLHKQKLARNIKLSIHDVLPSLQVLSSTHLIGTISENLAQHAKETYALDHRPAPFDIPTLHVVQAWYKQQANDAGLLWLRNLIKSICDMHFPHHDV